VSEAMAVLFRLIGLLSTEKMTLAEVCTPDAERAVQTARSVLGKFASQSYNPTHENIEPPYLTNLTNLTRLRSIAMFGP
jgi:hypothetical protein